MYRSSCEFLHSKFQNKPGIANLVDIYSYLSYEYTTPSAVIAAKSHLSYEQFKSELADLIVAYLKPFQVKNLLLHRRFLDDYYYYYFSQSHGPPESIRNVQ